MYNPDDDGVTHINVYSKGNTKIGRMLSHFYYSPIILPEDGKFNCVEGYWFWLQMSDIPGKDVLRELLGAGAKKTGAKLREEFPNHLDDIQFKKKIAVANACKIEQNTSISRELILSKLPFVHYYNYGGKVVVPNNSEWIMQILEYCRSWYMPT